MKLPAFKYEQQQWDRYKHFYMPPDWYGNKPIVQFSTGEVGIVNARPKPRARQEYLEYNIALTSTADGHFKFARPDGRPVPRAWLTADGGQYLLVDLDSRRAVRLTYSALHEANVPHYMQSMAGGFLREKGLPLGGEILIRQPCIMTPERKQWAADLRALAGAHCVVNDLEPSPWYTTLSPLATTVFNTPVEIALKNYYQTSDSLRHLWTYGIKFQREKEYEPYLLII